MGFFSGLTYNVRGLLLALRSPALFFLGLLRLIVVVVLTVLLAALILAYHQEILNALWDKPQSPWVVWLWHLVSWVLGLLLAGLTALVSYLLSQILFSVLVMDYMSRLTERRLTGGVLEARKVPPVRLFFLLLRQEIPRTFLPLGFSLLLTALSWLTPLGPAVTVAAALLTALCLAWDNTDLVPARRLLPFRERFGLLAGSLPFHLGFGLPFLIPGLNILLLSFAPVGATLYYLEQRAQQARPASA